MKMICLSAIVAIILGTHIPLVNGQDSERKKLDDTAKEVIANFGTMVAGIFAMIATKDEPDGKEAFAEALHTTVDGLVDLVITGMKRNEAVLTIDKRRFHAIITELLAQHDSQMRNVLRELLKERSANLLG